MPTTDTCEKEAAPRERPRSSEHPVGASGTPLDADTHAEALWDGTLTHFHGGTNITIYTMLLDRRAEDQPAYDIGLHVPVRVA